MNTKLYVTIIESTFRFNILRGRDKLAIDRFGSLPGPKLKPRYTSRSSAALNKLDVPSRWSSGHLSFSRSFGFIERRRAVQCRTCFRARRQLKASLCNGRRSSGHWVCISLALPTVPLSLFFSLATRLTVSNESQRVLHKSLLCFFPVLSPSFSLSFYHRRHRRHHRRPPHRHITQGDRARLAQADSSESRRSTGAALCNDPSRVF